MSTPIGPKVLALRISEIPVADFSEKHLREAYSEYFGSCPGCGDPQLTRMSKDELVAFFEAQRAFGPNDRLGMQTFLDELRSRVLCTECSELANAADRLAKEGARYFG